jgi:catalase (peroxidase I)
MMFTSDVSLLNDPKYTFYVNLFAKDSNALNNAFSHAWYKLVSRDMGPVTRCTGERIPPAQIFQNPLPPMPSKSEMPDFDKVRSLIQTAFGSDSNKLAEFVHLAYQCSSTFRATDYLGGCNGARIRFAPENTWANNRGTNDIIADLKSKVKDQYYEYGKLSYADLIVFAGQVALEQSSGLKFSFCFVRTDAEDGQGSEYLAPRKYNDFDPKNTILNVRDLQEISGLSARQMVALKGRLRPATQQKLNGYSGSWTTDSSKLSNAFYSTLLAESWELQVSTGGRNEYKAAGKDIFMTPEDLTLIYDPEYLAIVQEYASNNQLFLTEFASAWTHLVQADRFSGPTGNVCNAQATF